ncbi:flagellar filament capping protein FliD [Paenibacillus aestuarii]|uniref:Flagellar hook-associated protein 2 n=1 Tax=Paenibacillus aestuarii TaxID=516965 RepID=A0ABW0K5Q7_9BACL|nr:flagellar filament capping protein FliD [Paenibacillus aestuarii]
MTIRIGLNTWGTAPSTMGVNSGMDLSSMINQLMQASNAQKRIPLQQKLQVNQWKQDAYRSINTSLTAFQGQITNLQYSTGWQAQTATSNDPTKVTATATAGTPNATHTVTVNTLASGASVNSTAGITASPGLTGSAVGSLTVTSTNNQFNLTVNGVTKNITVAAGTYSNTATGGTSELSKAVQSAVDQAFGANTAIVSADSSNQLSITPFGSGAIPQVKISATSGSSLTSDLGFQSGGQAYKFDPTATLASQATAGKISSTLTSSGSFQINGQTISFDPTVDTLNSLISKVNQSAANVTMSYDATSDKVVVTTKNTGQSAQISWDATGDKGLLAALKINTATTVKGTDANVTIDGTTTSQSSNNFTFGGVTYNLVSQGSTTVSVANDTTALTKQITDFVNNYNTLINKISTKISEPTYRGYPPLTDDQSSVMTENQLSQYNALAQSGLLKDDDILKQTYNNFRSTVYQTAPGNTTYRALYDIGITTQAYNANDQANAGKLVVDTNKLQAALASNPNEVISIMQNTAQKLNSSILDSVSSIVKRAGSNGSSYDSPIYSLGYQAQTLESQISTAESRLDLEYKRYVTTFTNMDNAIGKSNSQMAYLQKL